MEAKPAGHVALSSEMVVDGNGDVVCGSCTFFFFLGEVVLGEGVVVLPWEEASMERGEEIPC